MIISKNLQNKLKQNGWDGELELDVLNRICVKYAKEFFEPRIGVGDTSFKELTVRLTTQKILSMLQQSKPQEEIEKYIFDNCLFNDKNKITN